MATMAYDLPWTDAFAPQDRHLFNSATTCQGTDVFAPKERLTKPEAVRKAAEIIQEVGVNTARHLEQAIRPERVKTFEQRVEWCRKNHKAWTDGKPGPVATMEGHLRKHILPRFGVLAVEAINETLVQEFVADLKRSIFERAQGMNWSVRTSVHRLRTAPRKNDGHRRAITLIPAALTAVTSWSPDMRP